MPMPLRRGGGREVGGKKKERESVDRLWRSGRYRGAQDKQNMSRLLQANPAGIAAFRQFYRVTGNECDF